MKYTLLLLLGIFTIGFGQAQTETLFNDDTSYGGFGGPILEFSNINGTLVGAVGGGGGLVINDFFVGGYGLGNDGASVSFNNQNYDIDFGHGGFWFGYALPQRKLFHLYTSFRIGWGSVELQQDGDKKFSDNLLALAPELGLEVNITEWFKLALSGGYRSVSGIDNLVEFNDVQVLNNSDFTGFYGGITFRFGGFNDDDYGHSNHSDGGDDDFNF